jgi:hypothetical protein
VHSQESHDPLLFEKELTTLKKQQLDFEKTEQEVLSAYKDQDEKIKFIELELKNLKKEQRVEDPVKFELNASFTPEPETDLA